MPSFNRSAMPLCAGFALLVAGLSAAAAPTCSARSTASAPPVVELYTSEGCSSCPPADKWLSRLKADPAVVALAFHVDYWDRLGWKDRFASPAFTQRQAEQQRSSGARFSYTPQVIINGVDRPDWPRARVGADAAAAPVEVQLTRDGSRVTAVVTPAAGTPARLAAWWAVTENGHVSAVKAGENQGATLTHDDVVRAYRPVAAWSSKAGSAATLQFELTGTADAAHPRQVNLVIIDADSGRPVQAVKLGC
ncbi:MAG: DUF1223 domain-containing protein [Pseudomonadota bacterium]